MWQVMRDMWTYAALRRRFIEKRERTKTTMTATAVAATRREKARERESESETANWCKGAQTKQQQKKTKYTTIRT